MTKHCGYISLLGLTNAGKSTLLNACVGQKLAGVSRKPQTTRNRILGVSLQGDNQFIFLDTPGFFQHQRSLKLHDLMNQQALSTIAEADIICYLVDVKKGCSEEDFSYLSEIIKRKNPQTHIFVVISKSDSIDNNSVNFCETSVRNDLKKIFLDANIETQFFTISSKNKDSIQEFLKSLAPYLIEREWDFDADSYTDRSENFVLSELIREKFFRLYGQELPFGTGVQVTETKKKENITVVSASLIVSRESHKAMVIGKGGAKLKELGSLARASLEMFFGTKVFLDLSVKLKKDWTSDQAIISQIQDLHGFDFSSKEAPLASELMDLSTLALEEMADSLS